MELYEKQLTESLSSYVSDRKAEVCIHDVSDWNKYLLLAEKHKLLPIAVEQTLDYMKADGMNEKELEYFIGKVRLSVAAQTFSTSAFGSLYSSLEKAGIKAVIVKGAVCRCLYRQPDYRSSYDEDIYVAPEQLENAVRVIENFGLKKVSDGDVITFAGEMGFHIELHRMLFSKDLSAYNELFDSVFECAVRQKVGEYEVWTPEPHMHLLFMILHCMKHFLYSGVGIRQICDIALFSSRFHEEIRWHELFIELAQLRADVFAMNILAAGVEYLGFSWDSYAVDKRIIDKYSSLIDSSELFEDCLEGGVYGSSSKHRLHSATITLLAYKKGSSKLSRLLSSVFLPLSQMKNKFTWLNKYPFLLPVAWLIRVFKYSATRSEGTPAQAAKLGEKRTLLLKKYAIIDHGKERRRYHVKEKKTKKQE